MKDRGPGHGDVFVPPGGLTDESEREYQVAGDHRLRQLDQTVQRQALDAVVEFVTRHGSIADSQTDIQRVVLGRAHHPSWFDGPPPG